MSVLAYQRTQNIAESNKQTEYRLFAQVTRALMNADRTDRVALVKAIDWNRRVWIALQADCANDQNALTDELRAGIISLAIWVQKHSRSVLRQNADITPLIRINRTVMEGLKSA